MRIQECRSCRLDQPVSNFPEKRRVCTVCHVSYINARQKWVKNGKAGPAPVYGGNVKGKQRTQDEIEFWRLADARPGEVRCKNCGRSKHPIDFAARLKAGKLTYAPVCKQCKSDERWCVTTLDPEKEGANYCLHYLQTKYKEEQAIHASDVPALWSLRCHHLDASIGPLTVRQWFYQQAGPAWLAAFHPEELQLNSTP